jgi:hypothetical protein
MWCEKCSIILLKAGGVLEMCLRFFRTIGVRGKVCEDYLQPLPWFWVRWERKEIIFFLRGFEMAWREKNKKPYV